MNSARTNILARLQQLRRESTGAIPASPIDTAAASQHALIAEFTRGLEKVCATHQTLSTPTQIDAAIEDYLQQVDAGQELVVAAAVSRLGLLGNSPRSQQPAPTRGNETSAVTLAYAGIAETGSLVMLSSADTPMTTNFLPDNFICLLKTQHLLKNMEALWARMRNQQQPMPRCVNIITGPSRTADVEQVIQMGAHGPRRVHVILWDEDR